MACIQKNTVIDCIVYDGIYILLSVQEVKGPSNGTSDLSVAYQLLPIDTDNIFICNQYVNGYSGVILDSF